MKKTITLISLCFLLQLFSISIYAQEKAKKINELLSKYSDYGKFNGAVLVAENGKIIFKKGYGYANFEWEIPNQTDTKFRLGSVSKQFTALLVLKLVENGKLKLDDAIQNYIPNLPTETGKITIHQLLTHSSGIANYTNDPSFFKEKMRNPYKPKEFMDTFINLPLEFTPGEKFKYSNSGYFTLGYIIEKVSGKTYEEYLHEIILLPLKMKNTGYDHNETLLKNRASGYDRKGKTIVNAKYIDMSIPYAAGSLYSTVEDLYLWEQALLSNKLLSQIHTELLFANQIKAWGGFYGYGWAIREVQNLNGSNIKVNEHGGSIMGFNANITRIPADKNVIILLNNTGNTVLYEMSEAILSILYQQPYNFPQKSLAFELQEIYSEKGLAAGSELYNKIKDGKAFKFSESEMNSVGYELLKLNKKKEAIAVFKIITEVLPKSGNAFDSLGEAYLADGDHKAAIVSYTKSIELDPDNEEGKKILEKISKMK